MTEKMHTNEIRRGMRMLVVGMARSGIAAAELAASLGIVPVINDLKTEDQFAGQLEGLKKLPVEWKLGMKAEEALPGCDALLISPGVPIQSPVVRLARDMGIPVVGELEFAARHKKCAMTALTGTNGKTTTTSLLAHIFASSGVHTVAAGNIGYPMSSAVRETENGDRIVCEVSSFQLETTSAFHPAAAAVLNISEDHLNRHGTMENYIALKRHIFDAQTESDYAVLNWDDAVCRKMAGGLRGRVLYFSRLSELSEGAYVKDGVITLCVDGCVHALCREEDLIIPGPHNLENALAAALLAFVSGVSAQDIAKGLATFTGVEHRIEFVREKDGVRYINDSKGTNSDSTEKAVLSMKNSTVLILGGSDKGTGFDKLARLIAETKEICHCIVLGETAEKIAKSLAGAGFAAVTKACSMEEAVKTAAQLAKAFPCGGNVLLSPACASFDMFRDYEERGRVFKEIVNNL